MMELQHDLDLDSIQRGRESVVSISRRTHRVPLPCSLATNSEDPLFTGNQ